VSIEYRIGDVFERLAEIPDGTIDLVVTSPPFLALRSYLPADHPDKAKEIGSEPTPAEFIDTLLALTAEWGRVLAPHGSICVELGDTYSGGWVGDSTPQADNKTGGPRLQDRRRTSHNKRNKLRESNLRGWPLPKSLTGIPTLYPWSLAYGRNLLTGEPSPAGLWRIRNVIVWARPNPPVGALGDKFRPATSYITVACKGQKRYFDLDAVRVEPGPVGGSATPGARKVTASRNDDGLPHITNNHPAGAPPLDWHTDGHPEDGDWLWKLSTQPYKGSHYATFPLALPRRLIEAMCPLRVCQVCGKPSERIAEKSYNGLTSNGRTAKTDSPYQTMRAASVVVETLGWSDCGHNTWRTGTVLDPFAGSGTTLEAAQLVGRHAIGIDLDSRNAELARDRVGMFLTVVDAA
jgi:site-specific DNA-methyltransferase (adenine-specific)